MSQESISFENNILNHSILHGENYTSFKYIELSGFVIACIIIIIYFAFQISNNELAQAVRLNSRIQKNISSLENSIIPIEEITINKIKSRRPPTTAFIFSCLDFGNSYLPVRINPETFNYQGIRRGNGDIWSVSKSGINDEAARQFCTFIITQRSDHTIECGQNMYSILGYPGYNNIDHWCNNSLQKYLNTISS